MTAIADKLSALTPERRGALLYVVAIAFLVSMDAMSKDLSSRYDTFQVIWARYAAQTLLVTALALPWLRSVLRTRYLGLQIVRSMLMFGATVTGFFAFALMPLADATAIFETSPLIVTALAALILRETVGLRRWMAVFIGFIGALVIVRPGGDVFGWVALLPLVTATCYAGYVIATRYVGESEGPWTPFFYSTLIGTAISSMIAPSVWTTPTLTDAGLMFLMGALGAVGQFFVILAFRSTAASVIAPLSYIGLVFATGYGVFLFGDVPDRWTVVGAGIVVASGVYVWRRKRTLQEGDA
jgi:drug/metabolite transporter (DMT)-like permease